MRRSQQFHAIAVISGLLLSGIEPLLALPSPEDKPEEVLRTEIITGARSPIDGRPLSAAEYAELQTEIATAPPGRPQVSVKVRRTINLLRIRRFIKTILPFVPIK